MKAYLYKANDKKHKYKIIFDDDKKELKFGSYGSSDLTIHKDEERKKRYIKRHSGLNEDWNDIKTKGALSRFILWEKPNIDEAIKFTEKKFKINIIKKF